jgi:hypothetical protein
VRDLLLLLSWDLKAAEQIPPPRQARGRNGTPQKQPCVTVKMV